MSPQENLTASLRSRRRLWLTGFDILAWGGAIALAAAERMDFDVDQVNWSHAAVFWVTACALYFGFGQALGLHRGRNALASFDEMVAVGATAAAAGLVCFVVNFTLQPVWLPRSVPLSATFAAVVVLGLGRALWRRTTEHSRLSARAGGSTPVLVMGAGDAARQLIRSMLTTDEAPWRPVALLDDDPMNRNLRLSGVPVRGTSDEIGRVARETGATLLVVAIPSIRAARLRVITDRALEAGLVVKVLPGVNELLGGHVGVGDVRDLDMEDLLGRHQIETDLTSIASYLTGRRVLVTGAGGSIGSELCRQVHQWGPSELIMLDRDESALHSVQLSIHGRALLDSPDVVLADIRDTKTMVQIFQERRPDVVFHAAALKHLPMLEQYPGEAVKTNVWGTLAVLEAARRVGVDKFVNISTDKAANPTSVLGYSKRVTEGLTAGVARRSTGTYLSVRFGNVLGSRGSVLTSFTAQIAGGGPVTVTHPDVTRYFMTVQESVQLVIQAAAIGRDGEALVLDMGEPVSIDSVARQLIKLSGRDAEIQYTGLRAGEKLSEVLFGDGEPDDRPVHPLISHVAVPPIDELDVQALNPWAVPTQISQALAGLCVDQAAAMRRQTLTVKKGSSRRSVTEPAP